MSLRPRAKETYVTESTRARRRRSIAATALECNALRRELPGARDRADRRRASNICARDLGRSWSAAVWPAACARSSDWNATDSARGAAARTAACCNAMQSSSKRFASERSAARHRAGVRSAADGRARSCTARRARNGPRRGYAGVDMETGLIDARARRGGPRRARYAAARDLERLAHCRCGDAETMELAAGDLARARGAARGCGARRRASLPKRRASAGGCV